MFGSVRKSRNAWSLALWLICLSSSGVLGQVQQGLVGVLYDSPDLSRPASLWYATSLSSDRMDWPRKNDFSALWRGSITGPADATVEFDVEANDGFRLGIDGQTVIDAWQDARTAVGSFSMAKGRRYPVEVAYRQVSGPSYLRVYWRWPGHPREELPASALSFRPADEAAIRERSQQRGAVSWEDIQFDVGSIISIHRPEDVEEKRRALMHLIFGTERFPADRLPDSVLSGIHDALFDTLPNLERIDRLVTEMDWSLNSVAYHFVPKRANGELMIYHQGHRGHFSNGLPVIRRLLLEGYHVVAMSMPLLGPNRKPIVSLPRFGRVRVVKHAILAFLKPRRGHPLRYFLEPVLRVINYAQRLGFERIHMIGISGGGWTTTLCAALDARISHSYPVAGSWPLYLRCLSGRGGSIGDYEQIVPEVYRVANYLELYVMGSYGPGRRQLQVLNEFDSCCFAGTGYHTYEAAVKERVEQLGQGRYSVFLDSTHREHKISEAALEAILKDLRK